MENLRPNKWEEVIGQEKAVELIKGTHLPFYIFSGPSGCGKTTCARILGASLNSDEKKVDIREYNAAQDNGIEFVRKLELSLLSKPLGTDIIVVILDECHGLTPEAQQAFLKILEEPPSGIHFIFCTTNKDALIETLKSRGLKVEFNVLSNNNMYSIINNALNKAAAIPWKEDNKMAIVKGCNGNARNAMIFLNAINFKEMPKDQILDYFSNGTYSKAVEFLNVYLNLTADNNKIILDLYNFIQNLEINAYEFLTGLLLIMQDWQFELLKDPKKEIKKLLALYKISNYITNFFPLTNNSYLIMNNLILNRKTILKLQ